MGINTLGFEDLRETQAETAQPEPQACTNAIGSRDYESSPAPYSTDLKTSWITSIHGWIFLSF